ncbi:hypothetical protein [Thermomonospora umbrina]|uniref:PknH-like protein n=1 Tax=Thermomonospora umbrina TaxID=111806 RepID=A0A3D9SLJ1_9ACTN|nr:hypothetical protein [Thermomonospora umbrina]REE96587.1 hypothetical protein DFJ69_2026 [Thermomonospora umbrina]
MNSGHHGPVRHQQWEPLPPPPGPVGSGRRSWPIPVVAVIAALVAVGAVFGVTRLTGGNGEGGRVASPSPTAPAAAPTLAGRTSPQGSITRVVTPCTLVPMPVRRSLVPVPIRPRRMPMSGRPGEDGRSTGCEWRTRRPEASRQRALSAEVALYSRTDARALKAARRTAQGRAGTSGTGTSGETLSWGAVQPLRGVGEEAFAQYTDTRTATARAGTATVWALYRNTLIEVTFGGSDGGTTPVDETTARGGATTAVRAVIDVLARCRSCAG